MPYDLILRGGALVDPANGVDGARDVGIADGRVVEVADRLDDGEAAAVIDVSGRILIPGVIDSHCHVGGTRERSRAIGHRMVAETGVTTVLDMGSTMQTLIAGLRDHGAGLNVASLFVHSAAFDFEHSDPTSAQIESALAQEVETGAFGLKVSGGHVPLTLDATARAVEVANRMGVYVAFHVGTTSAGSRITGVREIPDIVGADGRLHIAHVNSYCRGMDEPPLEECAEAIEILGDLRGRVVSEAYLSDFNGTSGRCEGDEVVDHVTQNCLAMSGYHPTRTDMRQAILDGFCSVNVTRGGRAELISGAEGVEAWEAASTRTGVSFPVCPPETAFYLAVARDEDGAFAIDAISTDGGGIPRNFLVDRGLALVRLGALSMADYVRKASLHPARMLGLERKGHLGVGADADVTVIDPALGRATMSLVAGRPIMVDGNVVGAGGTLLCTEAGRASAEAQGVAVEVVDPRQAAIYRGGVQAVV